MMLIKIQANQNRIYLSILKTLFLFYSLIAIIVFILVSLLSVVQSDGNYLHSVLASFIIIGCLSSYLLFSSAYNYRISLSVIHWYFVLVFLFMVPFAQYLGNYFKYNVEPRYILLGNIYIIAWCLIYQACYGRAVKNVPKIVLSMYANNSIKRANYIFTILNFAVVALTIWLVNIAGLEALLTRSSYGLLIKEIGGYGPWYHFIIHYIQPLILCIIIVNIGMLFIFKKVKKTYLTLYLIVISVIFSFISSNPLMFARYYLFTIIFGLIILITYKYLKKSLLFVYILFIGLFLSDWFDQFRSINSYSLVNLTYKIDWNYMFAGHFDAYENYIHVIKYVADRGIVYGSQFIGALLFFIPRSVWVNKPIGSGSFIAGYISNFQTVTNYNIAQPLIGEFYLNFHIIGIIIGATVIGLLTGWLDGRFLMACDNLKNMNISDKRIYDFYYLLHPFVIGLFLFILRGDLMSSFAYMVGFILAFYTIYILYIGINISRHR